MTATTLDQLVALGQEMHAPMARMRENLDAMGRSVNVLERTAVELRQDESRLGERIDAIKARIDGNGWGTNREASVSIGPKYIEGYWL